MAEVEREKDGEGRIEQTSNQIMVSFLLDKADDHIRSNRFAVK